MTAECAAVSTNLTLEGSIKEFVQLQKKTYSMLVFTLGANTKPELDDRRCLDFLTCVLCISDIYLSVVRCQLGLVTG